MKCVALIASTVALLVLANDARAQPALWDGGRRNTFELTLTREILQHDNRGGKGSSHDQDRLIERVIEARTDGVELEYDVPVGPRGRQPSSDWRFPARILKSAGGPIQLLNERELEARIDPWLTSNGLTRATCGHLIFTWNSFRINCDPQAVTTLIAAFDLTSFEAREGEIYRDPQATFGAPLTPDGSGRALVAEMAINPEAVRRSRAETDVGVAEILKKPLTLEEALAIRAKDEVSGVVQVKFDLARDGRASRKTTVRRVRIRRPNGDLDEQTVTETLERRQVSRR